MARTPSGVPLEDPHPAGRARISPILAGGALVVIATSLAVGVFLGIASQESQDNAQAQASVAESSVDVGFSRDMRDHHAQAVDMSVTVRDATEDPAVRTLALDIALTQQQQLGQMFGWLNAWGYPQVGTGAVMDWMATDDMGRMHHGAMGRESQSAQAPPQPTESPRAARMPGMATEAQLRALRQATGERAERIYLQLMIPHHRAAVVMAKFAAQNAMQPQVRELAQSIVNSQGAELKVLRSMLEARGGPVAGL